MIGINLFRSRTNDIFFGYEEPWSNFPSSKEAFEFEYLNSTVTIKRNGLYLLYVQVRVRPCSFTSYLTSLFPNSSHRRDPFSVQVMYIQDTVITLSVNGVEWLRCQHHQATYNCFDDNLVMRRESCNMLGVRPLLAGDKVRIQKGIQMSVVIMSQSTNFGIVKLGWQRVRRQTWKVEVVGHWTRFQKLNIIICILTFNS